MNGKKCKFAVDQVKYLGHILSGSGVAVDSSKFDLISGWPTPKTSKQVKSFLGVASYYRRFIERFSQISAIQLYENLVKSDNERCFRQTHSAEKNTTSLLRRPYDTMRYDSVYLMCSKKLTGSQLSLPHGINKK